MSKATLRLLIAEDNEADVYLIREALTAAHLHFEAQVATDGEQALAAVDRAASAPEDKFKAVILDLNLMTHSGLDILERIRSLPPLTDTPVVVLTSSASPAEESKAYLLGTDLYLRKPVDWAEFMRIGERIVDLFKTRAL